MTIREMPERWKYWDQFISDPSSDMEDAVSKEEMRTILILMKEMAETLEKVQTIAEMTRPYGSIAQTSLYKDVTPVLNKFMEWK